MYRTGRASAPRRPTTSVLAPTSPMPRPASSAAKTPATRSTRWRSCGRMPAAAMTRAIVVSPPPLGPERAGVPRLATITGDDARPARRGDHSGGAAGRVSHGLDRTGRDGGHDTAVRSDRRPEGAANVAKVTMPQLGESVAEGTIGKWLKQPSEHVAKYEPLLEVITDKVNAEVPSPFEGT